MKEKQRLLGIDLCRGIAAYAVILVHSGDKTWGLPVDPWAANFRLLFYFAVPFFLAVSFLFMTRKPNLAYSQSFWRSRFERILVPYAIWSLVYLIFRIGFFLASNKPERVSKLIQDPIQVIFFGWSSYQLYFLPLLLVGTSLILFTGYFANRQFATWKLVLFTSACIAVNQILFLSGNGFQLSQGIALESLFNTININIHDQGLLRVFVVYLTWLFKCLPYFLTSIILNRFLVKKEFITILKKPSFVTSLLLVLIANIIGIFFLPKATGELVKAYSIILFGISLSKYINQENRLIKNLGKCSFGIYLIHPLIMNFVKIFLSKIYPAITNEVTILTICSISISSFLVSWYIVYLIIKNKYLAKYMFGV